jgi:hypothetical protein
MPIVIVALASLVATPVIAPSTSTQFAWNVLDLATVRYR